MGRYAEAEPLYRRSLEVREKQLGRDHPDVATSLNNLANLYWSMGRYAEAEPLYRRSLEIREKRLGRRPPRRGHQPGQPGEPVPAHGPVRRGRAAVPPEPGGPGEAAGRDHLDVGTGLDNLAHLYREHGPVRRGRAAVPPQPGRSSRSGSGPTTPTWPLT